MNINQDITYTIVTPRTQLYYNEGLIVGSAIKYDKKMTTPDLEFAITNANKMAEANLGCLIEVYMQHAEFGEVRRIYFTIQLVMTGRLL